MRLRTEIRIPICKPEIDYESQILTIGSCFSSMIGGRLEERKFKILNNPFGTIFNPLTAFSLLGKSINNQPLDDRMFVQREGNFFHFELHSKIFADSKVGLVQKFEHIGEKVKSQIQTGSHLLLTFGTAFIHELSGTDNMVSNCHKVKAARFNKRKLKLEELLLGFDQFIQLLRQVNPGISIITTVSPVRHIKEGICENQWSKSILRVFCQEIVDKYSLVSYFPSYEIMMDDLRDYRFYKSDLIHPSDLAEEYIWKMFTDTFMSTKTMEPIKIIELLVKSLNHIPLQTGSKSHQQFLKDLKVKMERMQPEFDFSKELDLLLKKSL